MNKTALSAIPRPTVTKRYKDIVEMFPDAKHIVSAQRREIDGKDTLIINYFDIIEKEPLPEFRTFCQEDNYITQDLTTEKTKWKTGGWDKLTGEYYCYGGFGWNRRTALKHPTDGRTIISWCSKWLKRNKAKAPQDPRAIFSDYIVAYQNTIRSWRLEAKQKKKLAAIDEKMALFGDLPEDYQEFAEKTVLDDLNYFFYSKKDKRAYCTRCGHEFEIRAEGVYHKTIGIWNERDTLKHNRDFLCPYCNKYTEAKSEGMSRQGLYHAAWSVLVQTSGDKVLTRYFCHTKDFREDFKKPKIESRELFRAIHSAESSEDFEFTTYPYNHKVRWCPPRGRGWNWNPTEFSWPRGAVLYNRDFKLFKDTCMKYSCIDLYLKYVRIHKGKGSINPFIIDSYLNFYRKNPYIEQMLKIGWYHMVEDISKYPSEIIYAREPKIKNGRSICETCGITREQFLLLKKIHNGDPYLSDLKIVQKAALRGIRLNVKDMEELHYLDNINGHIDDFLDMMQYTTISKLSKYLTRQKIYHPSDYFDYIGWIRELELDLKNDFNLYPRDFYQRHEETSEEYRAFKDKEYQEKLKEFNRLLKKEKIQINLNNKTMMAAGFIIRLPKKVEELKAEGEILHHCVGTYIEKVLNNQTTIFFIRKKSDPDTPFYTLEWRDNKVIQCRGKHNKDMTADVEAFVKLFEEQMHMVAGG